MQFPRVLKFAWAAPCSLLGMVAALVAGAFGARVRPHRGTIEVTWREDLAACGRIATALPFRGIAIGHVILAVTGEELTVIRSHERVHVAQYERWGMFFFPAYLLSSAWEWLRGRDPYWDNHFERDARRRSMQQPAR